jgi:hypothetical protein
MASLVMNKDTHIILIMILLISLIQGCIICPERHSIEYTKSTKSIKVLSEDYYIKSVRITAYLPNKNYIELLDSNYSEFNQIGIRGATEMNLKSAGENYLIKGIQKPEQLLAEKYLEFVIKIEKFERKKNGKLTDMDVIKFVSTDLKKEKNIFESNQPCP